MKKYKKPEMHFVEPSADLSQGQTESIGNDELKQIIENEIFYEANPSFISRTIVGETVLVPTGEMTQRFNGLATFSATGQFLWQQLSEGKKTKTDLTHLLCNNFDCTFEEAKDGVCYFIKKALEKNIIIKTKLL